MYAIEGIDAVEAVELACERGGRQILAGVNFAVSRGQALLLRGPNGSGKTTLLRTIAGFLPLASGAVTFVSDGVRKRSTDGLGERCHYVGHLNAVKPRMSVLENVIFWQRFYGTSGGMADAEAALDAFRLLDLAEFPAAHLSQGQSRRLGLARLLAAPRPLWLLDEPSASLDVASTTLLEAQIEAHLRRGGLAIISTHLDLRLGETQEYRLNASTDYTGDSDFVAGK